MPRASAPEYQAGLLEFSRRLRVVHRDLGDPSYEAVAKACGVSVTTVHRYLTGKTLPPWRFVARYLGRVPSLDEAPSTLPAGALNSLRTAWASTRSVLRPIDGPAGFGRMGHLYQLPGLPDDPDPGKAEESRSRPA